MNISETYNYLTRARRDLWASLESAPGEVLSRPLLDGGRFHCIKDLVIHIPDVEDGWIHGDILGESMIQAGFPALRDSEGGPVFAGFPLVDLLDYWRAVEQSTLAWLPTLTAEDFNRVVPVEGWEEKRTTVDSILWHVMMHEVRHTAQIVMLLRMQGIKPPALDLLYYLPTA